ncbi:hypothetical protein N309_06248, partial [Tinamus guttatus]
PAAKDTRASEPKTVQADGKHQHSGKDLSHSPSKPVKPKKNTPTGEKQHTASESLTKPDANVVKEKNKDLHSSIGQSPSLKSLVKPQEKKSTAEKKQLTLPPDENKMYKARNLEKKSGSHKSKKYQ